MKKKYTIEFLYPDNQQVYLEDVELDAEEYKRISAFLSALESANVIEREGGGNPLIYPFAEPQFSTFSDLQQRWSEGSLIAMGKDHGIKL